MRARSRAVVAMLALALASTVAPSGAAAGRLDVDAQGRLQRAVLPAGGDTRTVFDRAGRLRFWMDPNGAAASPQRIGYRRYDTLGRVVEEGEVEGRFDRELLDRLAELPGEPSAPQRAWRRRLFHGAEAPGGEPASQLLAVHTRDGAGALHVQAFRHDTLGRVTTVVESVDDGGPAMATRYTYDARSRVVRVDGPAPVGQPHDFGLTYRYDTQDRLLAIGRHRHGRVEPAHYARFTWRADGRLAAEQRNPGSRTGRLLLRYGRDAQGRLLSLTASVAGRRLYEQSLRYEGALIAGMRQRHAPGDGGTARELRWRRGQPAAAAEVQLDPLGERLLQLRSADGTPHAYAHDRNGNVLRKTGHLERLEIDPFFDRPLSVDTADGSVVQWRYGGHAPERVWQRVQSGPPQARTTVQQAYYRGLDARPLLIVRDEAQAGGQAAPRQRRQRMVWGPTGLVAVIDDAGGAEAERFVAGNHQGSTTLVLDAQGRSLARYAYTPEGRVEHAGGAPLRGEPLVPYLFQGQEYDHVTGLHNFRARLYDSDSGRFLAPDPLLLPGRPAYLAMNGDAVNFVDPDGRMWCHVSDLAQSTRGHMAGLMSACAVEVIMVAVYLEVPLATAAFGVAAGVVGGALAIGYGGYLAYNLATSPGSRTQTASSIGAVIFFDQFAQGQNSFEERAWNFSYGAGVAFVQVAGGKTAVAFGTAWPARLGTPSTHVGRTYVLGYLSNTLATQPVNGAILALQEAFHRRPNAAVDPAEQLGWMGLNDAVGNACYWHCLYRRHVMGFAQRKPEYRAKGCMRFYIACKGFGRATQSVALSPQGDDWNKRLADTVPDVFFGAMTDYTVLTQMAAKVRVLDVQNFLFKPGIAPPVEVASPVDADLVSPLPGGGAFFGAGMAGNDAPVAMPYEPGVEVKDFKLR